MSYLANHYRALNEEFGHASGCGYGAGADCTCGKFNVEAGHKRNCGYGMGEDCNCADIRAHLEEPEKTTDECNVCPPSGGVCDACADPVATEDELPF